LNSPPPKPEVILTNFFAEPTVLLVPITSRDYVDLISKCFYLKNSKGMAIKISLQIVAYGLSVLNLSVSFN
jgi:hypothetical protein